MCVYRHVASFSENTKFGKENMKTSISHLTPSALIQFGIFMYSINSIAMERKTSPHPLQVLHFVSNMKEMESCISSHPDERTANKLCMHPLGRWTIYYGYNGNALHIEVP